MVDLLSCAFGGGIFLFIITANPSAMMPKAPPPARTQDGHLFIRLTSDMVRPVFVFTQRKTGRRFVVHGASLRGHSTLRRVVDAQSGDMVGNVYAVGATPWDAEAGAPIRRLMLKFEQPMAEWCIQYATADDDTSARARGLKEMKEAEITVRVQKPGSSQTVLAGESKRMPALELSPCINFSFGQER
jgi:hypothetical protein